MCLSLRLKTIIFIIFTTSLIKKNFKKIIGWGRNELTTKTHLLTLGLVNLGISNFNSKIYTRFLVDNDIHTIEHLKNSSMEDLSQYYFQKDDWDKITKLYIN